MNTNLSLPGQADDPVTAALAEADVVRRLQNAALAALRRWHTRVTSAQRMAEAEEVVQEAARRALKRRSDYETGRSVIRWLVGFVVMVCRERTRNRGVAVAPSMTGDVPSLEDLVLDLCRPVAETVADRVDVRQILDRLPEDDRELLRLRFFEDATFLQIGKQLGISEGAARVRLFRVLNGLRNEIASRGGGAAMSERENQLRLDLFAFRYLEAIEAGDLDMVDSLWAEADEDLELEHLLHELNDALATDDEERARAETAVTLAVEQHMPSAQIIRPTAGPLTVAEVAEFIRRHPPAGLTTDEIAVNERLRQSAQLVPTELGMTQVLDWGRQFGPLPETYWRTFRQAALELWMQRTSAENYQMAARPQRPKRPGDQT